MITPARTMQHLKQKTVHFFCAIFSLFACVFSFCGNPKGARGCVQKLSCCVLYHGTTFLSMGSMLERNPVRAEVVCKGVTATRVRQDLFFLFRGGGGFFFFKLDEERSGVSITLFSVYQYQVAKSFCLRRKQQTTACTAAASFATVILSPLFLFHPSSLTNGRPKPTAEERPPTFFCKSSSQKGATSWAAST